MAYQVYFSIRFSLAKPIFHVVGSFYSHAFWKSSLSFFSLPIRLHPHCVPLCVSVLLRGGPQQECFLMTIKVDCGAQCMRSIKPNASSDCGLGVAYQQCNESALCFLLLLLLRRLIVVLPLETWDYLSLIEGNFPLN